MHDVFQFRTLLQKVFGTFALTLFILLVCPTPASAKVILQEKGTVNISASETIDDDLFIGAENVSIDGNVKGSVFVGAGSVTIAGDVVGDVIAGTGNLTITDSKIGGNVIVGAGQVSLDSKTIIGGSLITGTGMLKNEASIARNAMVGAGTASIDSPVGKELRFGGRDLTLGPRTKIGGDVVYALGEKEGVYSQDPKATIAGEVRHITPPAQPDMNKARDDMRAFGRVAGRGFLVIGFLGSLLIGAILLKLFPKTVFAQANFLKNNFWGNFGTGLVMVLVLIPLLILLAITIVGLPLAGLILPLFCIGTHVAKLLSAYALGRFVATQFSWNKMGVYAVYAIGLAIFYLLRSLPVVGWFTSVFFTWVGLGTMWNYTKANLKNL